MIPNTLATTAERFNHAYQLALKANPPPCKEVKSQKSKVKSNSELLTFDLPLLTCEACPLNLSPESCPHRLLLKQAIEDRLTASNYQA